MQQFCEGQDVEVAVENPDPTLHPSILSFCWHNAKIIRYNPIGSYVVRFTDISLAQDTKVIPDCIRAIR